MELNWLELGIKDLFFDLDNTIWDFSNNSKETLKELFVAFNLEEICKVPFEKFINTYEVINKNLWDLYKLNGIDKNVLRIKRFNDTINTFSTENIELSIKVSMFYENNLVLKTNLMPYAIETLDYLKPKYNLHLLTNGFEDLQKEKIKNSKLTAYFNSLITSEKADYKKPNIKIFEYALNLNKTTRQQSVMIGDDYEVDIVGGKNAQFKTIFYNINNIKNTSSADFVIYNLLEIKNIL